MKNISITILFSSLFGIAGGFLGYFISKKKYLTLADKEIESMKKHQKEHDEYILKLYGINDKVQDKPTKETSKLLEGKGKPKKLQGEKPELSDAELQKKVIKNTKTIVDYTKPYAPTSENLDIHIISDQLFDESTYNYQSVQFYAGDSIIADMDDNCIKNYAELIGPVNVWINELTGNGHAVYVRNENTEMDYEILYNEDKWENVASPSQKAAMFIELNSDPNGYSD